ncbi:MAG: nucleotidyltransferase family protein [Gammaproteobacteria bacterium]
MRLNHEQIAIIRQAVQALAGANARAYVFGSRLRDDVRGGDIDLLLEADQAIGLLQRARIKSLLEERLAIPVDVIAIRRGAPLTAFQRIALDKGVPL